LIKDKGKHKTFCRKKADSDFPQDSASRHGLGSQSPSSRISLDPVAVPKCQGENREKKEKGMALRALHGTPWHSMALMALMALGCLCLVYVVYVVWEGVQYKLLPGSSGHEQKLAATCHASPQTCFG